MRIVDLNMIINTRISFFVFIAVMLFCISAHAAYWQYVGTATNDAKYSIDRESIEIQNNYRSVWELSENFVGKNIRGGTNKSKVVYDCMRKKTMILYSVDYDSKGRLKKSVDFSNSTKWSFVVPGSIGASLLQHVCAIKK